LADVRPVNEQIAFTGRATGPYLAVLCLGADWIVIKGVRATMQLVYKIGVKSLKSVEQCTGNEVHLLDWMRAL
jgi:hypothetical protein